MAPDALSFLFSRHHGLGPHLVFDHIEQYQFPSVLAERTHYCGHVVKQSNGAWPRPVAEKTASP